MIEKEIRMYKYKYVKLKNIIFRNPCSFEPKTAMIEIENGTSSGTVTPIENMK